MHMYFKQCLIIILFCILNEGIAADFNKRFFSEVKRYCFLFLFLSFFNSNSMHIVIALMLLWISLKEYNPRKLS